jgi:hypothetical protein
MSETGQTRTFPRLQAARVETPTRWDLGGSLPAKWFLHSGMRYAAFNRDRFRRARVYRRKNRTR